jgi:hypothetical protein
LVRAEVGQRLLRLFGPGQSEAEQLVIFCHGSTRINPD